MPDDRAQEAARSSAPHAPAPPGPARRRPPCRHHDADAQQAAGDAAPAATRPPDHEQRPRSDGRRASGGAPARRCAHQPMKARARSLIRSVSMADPRPVRRGSAARGGSDGVELALDVVDDHVGDRAGGRGHRHAARAPAHAPTADAVDQAHVDDVIATSGSTTRLQRALDTAARSSCGPSYGYGDSLRLVRRNSSACFMLSSSAAACDRTATCASCSRLRTRSASV